MLIRAMTGDDPLMPFLLAAMNWRDEGHWTEDLVLERPEVAHYVTGWMRSGDWGVIMLDQEAPVGAAWWRICTGDDPGYGYVGDDIPEVGLAVLPGLRGRGHASSLMRWLLASARAQRMPALSLSVEDGNVAARAVYERLGFVKVGRTGNSDTLVLQLL
ncbi:GNAT family N-acetyltransferase [Demequina sp. TTPB684]|uniref:GNAT family N-acetyltransferase n=1 Tax=unclassified Demequina TaxID=2620311 RepID=UPI001CF5E1AA|nr:MULTISPECIES: GNAT family N-acetyltransferase [unclassified Demequina]MCB2413829.1 GNAT family N-acetyltransferase [Demequina sp. TTPB684]UPU89141.1 GNAT family N-acetyltransferase [Demequina sp. TMPB413]